MVRGAQLIRRSVCGKRALENVDMSILQFLFASGDVTGCDILSCNFAD